MLDEKRKGAIAITLVKEYFKREGIRFANFEKELKEEARELGLSYEELREFVLSIISEVLHETVPDLSVAQL